jgi:trehalose 6-phosphate phosphatase
LRCSCACIAHESVWYHRLVQHLLTPAGLAALLAFDQPRGLIALDFDGTIAPLTDDPAAVCMLEALVAPIQALSALRPVAIISGRSIADLAPRVPIARVTLFGNHGIENGPGWPDSGAGYRAMATHWREALGRSGIPAQPSLPVWVEDKTYSLTIHCRGGNIQSIEASIATLDPAPRVIPGHDVFNLVPHGAPNKGDALLCSAREHELDRAIFVGDDRTDEDAFVVEGLNVFAIRVGWSASSRASYYVHSPIEVGTALKALAHSA